jgi:hypothetical protein
MSNLLFWSSLVLAVVYFSLYVWLLFKHRLFNVHRIWSLAESGSRAAQICIASGILTILLAVTSAFV